MKSTEIERLIKSDILSIENRVRHAFNQGYDLGYKEGIEKSEKQPKTGHWIEHPEIKTSTPEYLMFYECSECGDQQCFCKSDIHRKNFCNNCGARMVEPQERSDKA